MKKCGLNHTVYLAAPLTFRIDLEVSEGDKPFMHLSPWRANPSAMFLGAEREASNS